MIEFEKHGSKLIIKYWNDSESYDDLDKILRENEEYNLHKVFLLQNDNRCSDLEEENSSRCFKFGVLEDGYYSIDKDTLGIENSLFIHKDIDLWKGYFVADNNISVFRLIDGMVKQDIIIGGPREDAIPVKAFLDLIKQFPTSTERKHYAQMRVEKVLKDFFPTMINASEKYEKYRNREINTSKKSELENFWPYELGKYEEILLRMEQMLNDAQVYKENNWQKEIATVFLLLYPKYITILQKVQMPDSFADAQHREMDMVLVDADGSIDVLEIKKPGEESVLRPGMYRDNYVPSPNLSGTIMQLQKYILNLTRWGLTGEKELTKKHRDKLPEKLSLKINNPKGIVIFGRSNELDEKQKVDFDIIRRKYSSIIDIISYDDLVQRLQNTIFMLKKSI